MLKLSPEKQILALVAAWWIPFTVTIVFLYLIGGFGKAGVRGSKFLDIVDLYILNY